MAGRNESGSSQATALYNLARYLRWRRARGLEADPGVLAQECLSGTNRTLIELLNPLVEYCLGGTFDGSSLEIRKKNFKEVVSFYRAHYITLPRAKISGGEAGQCVGEEMTATKFLQLTKIVLLKARLTPKARAVILTMLQSGMDASTTMSVFKFYAYPQLIGYFGTVEL